MLAEARPIVDVPILFSAYPGFHSERFRRAPRLERKSRNLESRKMGTHICFNGDPSKDITVLEEVKLVIGAGAIYKDERRGWC